jgi:myosin heavy subunit
MTDLEDHVKSITETAEETQTHMKTTTDEDVHNVMEAIDRASERSDHLKKLIESSAETIRALQESERELSASKESLQEKTESQNTEIERLQEEKQDIEKKHADTIGENQALQRQQRETMNKLNKLEENLKNANVQDTINGLKEQNKQLDQVAHMETKLQALNQKLAEIYSSIPLEQTCPYQTEPTFPLVGTYTVSKKSSMYILQPKETDTNKQDASVQEESELESQTTGDQKQLEPEDDTMDKIQIPQDNFETIFESNVPDEAYADDSFNEIKFDVDIEVYTSLSISPTHAQTDTRLLVPKSLWICISNALRLRNKEIDPSTVRIERNDDSYTVYWHDTNGSCCDKLDVKREYEGYAIRGYEFPHERESIPSTLSNTSIEQNKLENISAYKPTRVTRGRGRGRGKGKKT